MFYDPLIAKLCAHGPDRAAATANLREALDGFVIRGLGHNIPFLSAVLANPRFAEGRLTTNFIAEEYGERFQDPPLPEARRRDLAAVATAMKLAEAERAAQVSGRLRGWLHQPETAWSVKLGHEFLTVELEPGSGGGLALVVDGQRLVVSLGWQPGAALARAVVDGRAITVQVDRVLEGYRLVHGGAELVAVVRSRRAADYAARMPAKVPPDTSRLVRSPMPGLIVKVAVDVGQEVKAGQELCILEAMKMENVLRAERDGRLTEVNVAPRDTVAADQVLMAFG
jgi:propionyl-CoA carboxylase alpha chain